MKNLSWLTVGEETAIAIVEGDRSAGRKECSRQLSGEGVCNSSHPFLSEQKAESGQELGLIYETGNTTYPNVDPSPKGSIALRNQLGFKC